MTSSFRSALTCPRCGQTNVIAAADLPPGSELHCSCCKSLIGRWAQTAKGKGFVPETSNPRAGLDNEVNTADL